jgi:DNA-binding transcriptional MerR regulator
MNEELRPGQVAAAAGVNLETLRYYERRGLLGHPDRTLGGHRVYGRETVKLLRSIKTAQRLGFTLTEVAEMIDVFEHHRGASRSDELRTRARAKLAEVDRKIADLESIRTVLLAAVNGTCLDGVACDTTWSSPFVDACSMARTLIDLPGGHRDLAG